MYHGSIFPFGRRYLILHVSNIGVIVRFSPVEPQLHTEGRKGDFESTSTISRPWSLAMVVSLGFPDLARSLEKSCDVGRPEVDSQSARPS